MTALRIGPGPSFVDPAEALFHDEEIDGPLTDRLRILVLTMEAERAVVASRVAGFDDIDLVGAGDVPDLPNGTATGPEFNARSSSWLYWLSGWRWRRFICGWCGDNWF